MSGLKAQGGNKAPGDQVSYVGAMGLGGNQSLKGESEPESEPKGCHSEIRRDMRSLYESIGGSRDNATTWSG